MLNEVGHSQYRNAVASGRAPNIQHRVQRADPTLPRYGTDCVPREDHHNA
jgi:hypothetical protein